MKDQDVWTLSSRRDALRYEHVAGEFGLEASETGWMILQEGEQIGRAFETSDAAAACVEQLLME